MRIFYDALFTIIDHYQSLYYNYSKLTSLENRDRFSADCCPVDCVKIERMIRKRETTSL